MGRWIIDGETVSGFSRDASDIDYNNTGTGLSSTDVQGAISELNSNLTNALGLHLDSSDNLNSIVNGGLYSWTNAPNNAPYANAVMLVIPISTTRAVQLIFPADTNASARKRVLWDGTWSETSTL